MWLWESLSKPWQKALLEVKPEIEAIEKALDRQGTFNPGPEKIFIALGQSPDEFRVVIVGQDPYPNPNQAMGLAFSIPAEQKSVPPTLRNIQKEFESDIGKTLGNDLSTWKESGVLLLNRILTCRSEESLSHEKLGWQSITNQIITSVIEANPNTVAILWGNYASAVEPLFNPKLVIKSVHPSPLSSHRGFFGSKPFSKANQLLADTGQQPIDWA
ncbi:MAG: hypothetical protein RLZZ571_205 [Actinomycetota bacterium]|jgi:uracil-DNA glycosylase